MSARFPAGRLFKQLDPIRFPEILLRRTSWEADAKEAFYARLKRSRSTESPLITEEDMNRLTDGEIDEFDRIVSELPGDTDGSADRC